MTTARTIDVRLEVVGAGTFKSEMAGATQSIRQVGVAEREMQATNAGTTASLDKIGSTSKTAVASMLGFGAATGGLFLLSKGVQTIRDEVIGLDESLHEAASIMANVTDDDMRKMEETARHLAIEFGVSATTIAHGFYGLASAGLDVQQSIAALPQVVAFAKAGMIDLDTAIELATSAQSAMGLSSKDAAANLEGLKRVTDNLTEANNLSQGELQDFAEALSNKAAAAGRTFGQSIEQVVGVLDAFAQTGVRGRRAGEAYSILLRELTVNAQDLTKLNVQVFDSTGKLRDIPTIFSEIERTLGPMSDKQRVAALQTANFSDEGKKMVLQLLGMSGAMRDYIDQQERLSKGQTLSVAEKQMESLQNKIAQVYQIAIEGARRGIDGLEQFAAFLVEEFSPAFDKIGSIAGTTAHLLAPFVTLIGGGALMAGKVAIEGIASALDHTAGFLKDHERLVELLVVLYGARLVFAATEASVALGKVAAAKIAEWADTVVAAVWRVIGRFMTLREELLATNTSFATLRAGWAAFGTGVVFAGVAAMLLGIVDTLRTANAEGAKFAHDFVAGLKIDPYSKDSLLSGIREVEGEIDRLRDKIRTKINPEGFGESLLDIVGKIFGQHPVNDDVFDIYGKIHGLNENELKSLEAQYTHLYGEIGKGAVYTGQRIEGEFNKAFRISTAGADFAKAMQRGFTSDELAQLGTPTEQYNRKIEELAALAKKTGVDLDSDFAPALARTYDRLHGLDPAGQEAAIAIDKVGDAADVGTDKAKAFSDALDAISQAAFGMGDAVRGARGAMLDLVDASKTQDGARVTWGDNATREGLAFQQAAEDVITADQKVLVQMAAHGKTGKEIQAAAAFMAEGFVQQAVALGIPEEAARKLADTLRLTDAQIRSMKLKVQTDASEIDSMQDKLKHAQRVLDALERQNTKVRVDPADLDAARHKVAVLQAQVDYLDRHPSLLKIDHSDVDKAVANLVDAKKARQDLLDAPGSPDPLKLRAANAAIDTAKSKLKEATEKATDLNNKDVKPKVDINDSAFRSKESHIDSTLRRWGSTTVTPTVRAPSVPEPPVDANGNGIRGDDIQPGAMFGGIYLPMTPGVIRFADGGQLVTSPAESRTFSSGGFMESSAPVAQIAPAGAWRVWAEPETGGEAYIPLSPQKRGRSTTILSHVASMFGLDVGPRRFADGGYTHTAGHTEDEGNTDQDAFRPLSNAARRALDARLRDMAEQRLARLHLAFGPLGLHDPSIKWLSNAAMAAQYKGVTIFGPNVGGASGPLANGNAQTGVIQLNRDAILASRMPGMLVRLAVTKEWAQTVLPHFLNTDTKIRRYLDAIGYRYKTDEHLVDDLWTGSAQLGGNTTTPADLFGYLAARSITGMRAYREYPEDIVDRLRKAGLLPGRIASDREIAFLARLIRKPPRTPLERAIDALATVPADDDAPDDGGIDSGATTTAMTHSGRGYHVPGTGIVRFADGGTLKREPLPHFDGGGVVPGRLGEPRLVVAHGGERFLSPRDSVTFASGGITYSTDIANEANRQGEIASVARSMAGAPAFRNAVAAATAGETDPARRLEETNQALRETAQLYVEVAHAAGKAAADQLAASGLVGDGLSNAGQKIIEDAQAARQAEQQFRDERKATRRQLIDDEYEDDKISLRRYVEILHRRLAETKKYSADWLSIHEQIRQAQRAADEEDKANADAKAQAKQTTFDKYASPQQSATSLVGAFGTEKTVTPQMVEGFLANVEEGVRQFRDVIRSLVSRGYNTGLVQQIAEQGPSALPLAKALLQVPVAEVNGSIHDINAIIQSASQSDALTFGANEQWQVKPAKHYTAPKLESEADAESAVHKARAAYDHALRVYRNDSKHGHDRQLGADMKAIKDAEQALRDARRELAQASSNATAPLNEWGKPVTYEPPVPPQLAPAPPPGFLGSGRISTGTPDTFARSAAAPQLDRAILAAPMPAQSIDSSTHLSIGSIGIDLRGAATSSTSPDAIRRLVKAGVSDAVDELVGSMRRDLRSKAKSPTGR